MLVVSVVNAYIGSMNCEQHDLNGSTPRKSDYPLIFEYYRSSSDEATSRKPGATTRSVKISELPEIVVGESAFETLILEEFRCDPDAEITDELLEEMTEANFHREVAVIRFLLMNKVECAREFRQLDVNLDLVSWIEEAVSHYMEQR